VVFLELYLLVVSLNIKIDSLGGAISSLLHLKYLWDTKPVQTKSIGFGSPMLYDESVLQWLTLKKYNTLFKTFCNRSDLVPGITLGLADGLKQNLKGSTDNSLLLSATIGILCREVTKHYVPVGVYVFLEVGNFWETVDSELIISRLQQNRSIGENVKFHEIACYREELRGYIQEDQDAILIPKAAE
jgi:Lipase (class 3)